MTGIYERLAKFLNELPAGYPPTESGVELRILQKLFAPPEAELFLHLHLIAESPNVVAYRAHQPLEEVARMLDSMEHKGLISGDHKPGKTPQYSVNQFVVGFMEEQVDHLDRELVDLVDEYLPTFFKQGPWIKVPQIRTIPIGVSVPLQLDVMPYERAEEILNAHTSFSVRNCICRQGHQIKGDDCGKPLETCLSFDGGAEHSVAMGRGRMISKDEALSILKLAEQVGLVLQPSNSKDPIFICACCGCCCGVLRNLKLHEKPAELVANPFIAQFAPDLCADCGMCSERCQMDAIKSGPSGAAEFNADRCIGCGLCVSTCPSGALTLVRKPEQPAIPRDTVSNYLELGQSRDKFSTAKLAGTVVKSKIDRLIAPR
ncbi:MAG: 4Fe-4S binding protein [Anaerolineaceae bacterium]|nr:4Fe-4S binding protein [Anaerolineaceae bacterium]